MNRKSITIIFVISLLISVFLFFAQTAFAVDTGPISYWPADENAIDIISGNNGTLVGNTTYAPGKVGQAFSFDGDGDYVDVGNINLPSTFSIDAWIKPTDTGLQVIFAKDNVGARSYVFYLANGKLTLWVRNGSGQVTMYESSQPAATVGQWNHVVAVYDGNGAAGQKIKFYVNGQSVDTQIAAGAVDADNGGTPEINTLNTRIGSRESDLFFKGLIDEAKIYNRALSASEIADEYEDVVPPELDYGDAPDPTFPSLKVNNGARHDGPKDFYFGNDVNYEADSNQVNADDYDDGLISISPLSFYVTNPSGTQRYVNVLADLNWDGDWKDEGELVVSNYAVTATGSYTADGANIPEDWWEWETPWLRMTITETPLSNYDGTTPNPFNGGETEDYVSSTPWYWWVPPVIILYPPDPPWTPSKPGDNFVIGQDINLKVKIGGSETDNSNIERVVATIDGGAQTKLLELFDPFNNLWILPNSLLWEGIPDPTGLHTITVKAQNTAGRSGPESSVIVYVDPLANNQPPLADAGPDIMLENLGDIPVLDASASSDPDSATGDYITTYEWDLDNDGHYDVFGETPVIPPGFFGPGSEPFAGNIVFKGGEISVEVRDTFSATDTDTAIIRVNDPFPSFTVTPNPALTSQEVTFDPSASFHGNSPERSIVKYEWDFHENGGTFTSILPVQAKFTFNEVGTHPVTLKVTDCHDETSIITQNVTISQNLAPVVDAGSDRTLVEGDAQDCNSNNVPDECDVAQGKPGIHDECDINNGDPNDKTEIIEINFTDPDSVGPHTGTIDWGDGTGPQEAGIVEANGSGTVHGSHKYTNNGSYTVTVKVDDGLTGGVGTDTFKVNVQDKPAPPPQTGGGNSGGQTVTPAPAPPVVNNQAQKNALNKQIKNLKKKVANLNKQIKNLKKKLKKAKAKQKKALKKKMSKLNKQIKSSKKKVASLKKQIKGLK